MDRIKRTRPSPALVISMIALSVALGGSALAATAITSKKDVNNKGNLTKKAVDTNNIAGKAVTTKKLANGAAKENKIGDGAVSSSKLGLESVSSSKLGLESVRASKLAPIRQVTETTTIAEDTTGSATATCESSEKVIGGGHMTGLSTLNALFVQEHKRQENGWRVGGLAQGDTVNLTTYAYCLENGNG